MAFVIAGIAATVGLAACGGDEVEDGASSTTSVSPRVPSSSSSSSSSPTSGSTTSSSGSSTSPTGSESTDTDLPPEATKKTKAGAIAFTKLWFEESAKAVHSGDFSWMNAHTNSDCKPCNTLLDAAQKRADQGIRSSKNPMKIGTATGTRRASGDGYKVTLPMTSAGYDLVDKNGDAVRRYKGAKYNFVTHTQWTGDHWELLDWVTSR